MQLANQPNKLIKKLLLDINEKNQIIGEEATQTIKVPYTVLSQLLYIVGHVAIRTMVHLDTFIYKELKRRNAVRSMQGKDKKQAKNIVSPSPNKSRSAQSVVSKSRSVSQINIAQEDNGEEALEGAVDDADAEFVNNAVEREILTGDGLLAKFVYVDLPCRVEKLITFCCNNLLLLYLLLNR